jgi:hypothetical protein
MRGSIDASAALNTKKAIGKKVSVWARITPCEPKMTHCNALGSAMPSQAPTS